ncbi:hypothetical protein HMN09_00764300 [Mycena chlorophos]|uniref:Transmembrane protein n=1 Tax=Mycena chlorophos TaxID=658473 RepID=A0A8H6W5Y1_MYCCL|nr:hypothetical protein HMN09_00764300 [Mycena chlorophos]
MSSFAQTLKNAGISLAPGLFIGICAAGVVLLVLLVVGIVMCVRARTKRKIMDGAFDKPTLSALSLAQPRPSLPNYYYDAEAQQQQHEVVGRGVQQQEATYQQLLRDLQRPSSRTGSPLPDQSPRDMTEYRHAAPAPVIVAPPPAATALTRPMLKPSPLKRGLSVRSVDSASESVYSVASAPLDAHEQNYQSFAATLPPVPASPSTPITPKWPSSPNAYVWPKRQRASVIRTELAPETYNKVRWRTDSSETVPSSPVAQALPASGLRINVPRPTADADPGSAGTANVYYTPTSAAFAPPSPQQRPRQF